jgi:hypothetical protein
VIVMTRPRRGLKSWKEGIMNRDGNLGILYCYCRARFAWVVCP